MRVKAGLYANAQTAGDPLDRVKAEAHRLAGKGRIDEAVDLLGRALQKNPARTDLLLAAARILLQGERLLDAIEVLLVLDAHLPNHPEVTSLLGSVYSRTRQFSRAIPFLEQSAKLEPNDPATWISLAKAYENLGDQTPALSAIQNAIRLKPFDPAQRASAAALLHHRGQAEDARHALLDIPEVARRPDIRLMEAMMFSVIPDSIENIESQRDHLRNTLLDLGTSGETIDNPEDALRQTTFLLGYHGLRDRELIQLWAETLERICPALHHIAPSIGKDRRSGPIRVGFVSSNMRNHSVGRVLNRIMKEFDRSRFEVTLFELPGKFNGGQELGRECADATVQVPDSLPEARRAIERHDPDILLFPDFVLDPFNDMLAFSRLAPVQCSTWGHPGTSGRPSIDYWISCEDWEPEGNEALYTERLIRLSKPPMIASRLEPPETIVSREDLSLPEGTLYGCPQSIYKLHPSFDRILAAILERDPESHVVVIGGVQPHWLRQFELRFGRIYGQHSSRVLMLPHLSTERYLSLLAHLAVSLDPTHFGGANTSMEAFSMGLPVVTWPGDQLRNRQTLSFYRMMNFTELVVDTENAYVELALRLAHEPEYRAYVSQEIVRRCSVIFDTVDVVREWECFFEGALRDKGLLAC